MAKISKNGTGLFILALSIFGFNVSEEQVIDLVTAIGTIISFTLMVYNQMERRDVSGFFFKK